jgi:hypothetical protein
VEVGVDPIAERHTARGVRTLTEVAATCCGGDDNGVEPLRTARSPDRSRHRLPIK